MCSDQLNQVSHKHTAGFSPLLHSVITEYLIANKIKGNLLLFSHLSMMMFVIVKIVANLGIFKDLFGCQYSIRRICLIYIMTLDLGRST